MPEKPILPQLAAVRFSQYFVLFKEVKSVARPLQKCRKKLHLLVFFSKNLQIIVLEFIKREPK